MPTKMNSRKRQMTWRGCEYPDCKEPHYARGLCRHHYETSPEYKAAKREYAKTPKQRARRNKYRQEYSKRPEVQAKRRAYTKRPEVRARLTAKQREHNKRLTPKQINARRAYQRLHYPRYARRDPDKLVEKCIKLGLSKETAEAYVKDGNLLKQREKQLALTQSEKGETP